MASEAHLQGIARFLVGFGTEEDSDRRDYNFDFCGCIKYGPDGVPILIKPVDDSGYSLGALQLDFGQIQGAVEPFISAFEAWQKATPGAPHLASSHADAAAAMKMNGKALNAAPSNGLRQQDVDAFSTYVRSPDGSDWVNTRIDNYLVGSDAQTTVVYSGEHYGYSLVGVARKVEVTATFKKFDAQNRTDVTDLLYAMTMKAYNQGPTACMTILLPFLDNDQDVDTIVNWPNQFSNAMNSGVNNTIALSQYWTKLITPTSEWNPPKWLLEINGTMTAQCLANQRKASATNGAYLAAKQVFESSGLFGHFVQAIQDDQNYIPSKIFNPSTGAIAINPKTGRIYQGVMAKNKIGYAWDTARNAFELTGGIWTAIPVETINARQSLLSQAMGFVRRTFGLD
jgi:hypothetical protein